MTPSLPRAILAVLSVLPAAGCCTMARLFCGPDTSPWVPVAFTSEKAAMATFLEAVRRDDPVVAYDCLAEEFKQQHGVDQLSELFGWQQIKQQTPALHMLGYAEPGEPIAQGNGRCRFEFTVHGVQLRVDLVRQSYWSIRFQQPERDDHGKSIGWMAREQSRYVPSLHGLLRVATPDADADRTRVSVEPQAFSHDGEASIPVEQIDAITFARDWKIAAIEVRQ